MFDGGTLKGGGRIDQPPFLDPYSQGAVATLSDRKPALPAAALLPDQGGPCFAEHEEPVKRS